MAKSPEDRLLDVMRAQLGYTESPNGWSVFGQWWAKRHGKPEEWAREPWCDMFVSWAANKAGLLAVVGDSAWTPGHAQWFKDRGQWGQTPRKGAVVFFDWAGSKNIPAIDHVGVVESVRKDGTVVTIEGNTSNRVMRRERSMSVIAGFGYPLYGGKSTTPAAAADRTEEIVKTLPLLKRGSKGYDVKTVFYLLHARGYGLNDSIDDTVFGGPLEEALRAFQKAAGLKVDGQCGPKTWPKLLRMD
ncbi:Putative peptidoglycan binding domain-containing protein [Nonomuraea maritima]|uniref:Putative peptidoglycan binding domain-containing protein n=1 Tax=Nonomuraea maritima TaxID=683260 RepID=A0A1G9MF69_9ACTN|nr:CHAP domain-containing protein [Nonomuraea maritima]SDL72774.1 Putative peptidoglycan binding domain-containing protein [Nonomuraea maritima]